MSSLWLMQSGLQSKMFLSNSIGLRGPNLTHIWPPPPKSFLCRNVILVNDLGESLCNFFYKTRPTFFYVAKLIFRSFATFFRLTIFWSDPNKGFLFTDCRSACNHTARITTVHWSLVKDGDVILFYFWILLNRNLQLHFSLG